MDWLNLHTSKLDSAEFLGSEPVDRATWLCLLRYCVGQENSGIIDNCGDWGDRKWQQLCRVTIEEVRRPSPLWSWMDGSIIVKFYPIEKQHETQALRSQSREAAAKRWAKERFGDAVRMPDGMRDGMPDGMRDALPDALRDAMQKGNQNRREENRREGRQEAARVRAEAPPPPPTPSQSKKTGKPSTQTLLAEFGLPNGPSACAEWRGGLNRIAKARSLAEARCFLAWAIQVCKAQGVIVEHWRHVRLLAIEWDNGARDEHFEGAA